jgi:hypothetical protein
VPGSWLRTDHVQDRLGLNEVTTFTGDLVVNGRAGTACGMFGSRHSREGVSDSAPEALAGEEGFEPSTF